MVVLTSSQRVQRHIEVDPARDEHPVDRDALRGRRTEPSGRRRRMQSQGLVDDAVQVLRVLRHPDVERTV